MNDHPHNLAWFAKHRKEIYSFVRPLRISIEAKKRILLIVAEVKAGKKEIVECIKQDYPSLKAYYITSLNRKDVKNQQIELAQYDIETSPEPAEPGTPAVPDSPGLDTAPISSRIFDMSDSFTSLSISPPI